MYQRRSLRHIPYLLGKIESDSFIGVLTSLGDPSRGWLR
jgi:hypothetical protein